MNTNESLETPCQQTSPEVTGNENDQLFEHQKTLMAIQPKIRGEEPDAKRFKFLTPVTSFPIGGEEYRMTARKSTTADEECNTLQDEQRTPTLRVKNEPIASNEQPVSSGTPAVPAAVPATSKSRMEHPVVGSEKWKEMKRISHMEVERRRRETINDYINELARMIRTEHRQKGAILRTTVAHIKSQKEQHDADAQKWALEKLVAEQTIRQLQDEMEKYKARYEKLREATKGQYDDTSDDGSDDEQQQ
ncbi:hypothetical protein BCR42DRAFT_413946 [Absidia repens]|uniref:BHLH domain-containing protein n=1 Tax=Absidia repens TaxID=90262 RepID=A0A1X2IIB1_9FUNG|nr:hypothetical protein BCR42DRAFT_413946 [Absidia repens]